MSDIKQTIDWENVKQMCQAEADLVHGEEPSIEKTHFRVGCMSGYKLAAPEIDCLRAENARLKAEVKLIGETLIEFTIKPIKGRDDLSPFTAKFAIDEFEDNGLAQLLIDEGYWKSMGHPCDSYTILKREIVTLKPT